MTRPPLWQKAPDGTLDTTATFKVLCIYATMGVFLFIGVGALASLIYQWQHDGRPLDPSEAWRSVLNSIFLFLGAAFGVAYAAGIGKAAIAPKVAEAEAVRETTKAKIATAEMPVAAGSRSVTAQLASAVVSREPSKYDDESTPE